MAAGLVVFAIVLVLGVFTAGQSTARGCVDVSILGATGGSAIHQCGNDAKALCRSAGSAGNVTETVREIQAACRKYGFKVG